MSDNKKKAIKSKAYDRMNDIKPLVLFVTIVNNGQSTAINRIFEQAGASLQFNQKGIGTAQSDVLSILGITDNHKDIVFSIVKREVVEDLKKELGAFFAANKRNKGISFSIPLTSVAGVRVYQFLSNSL